MKYSKKLLIILLIGLFGISFLPINDVLLANPLERIIKVLELPVKKFPTKSNKKTTIKEEILTDYNISTYNGQTVNTCNGNFYDSGGSSSAYDNSENYSVTFCSNNGNPIIIDFTAFDIEYDASCNYDGLRIYDGSDATATLLGTYCGTNSPGTVTASGTCLHFVFYSDGSVTNPGWEATISCAGAPPVIPLYATLDNIDNATCANLDGNIAITTTGGTTPYTFAWSNGVTTEDLTNIPAGNYTVTVSDAVGAQVVENYTVYSISPVSIGYSVTNAACPASTGAINITLLNGTSPYTFNWSNGATTEDISNLSDGLYEVTVNDANGCEAITSILVGCGAENCSNGIDDDGDGFIDYYDSDCPCDNSGFFYGNCVPSCQYTPPPGSSGFDLTTEWTGTIGVTNISQLLVADMDGYPDEVPEIVAMKAMNYHASDVNAIYILDGEDGSLKFHPNTLRIHNRNKGLAVGDVDSDGRAEFYYVTAADEATGNATKIACYEYNPAGTNPAGSGMGTFDLQWTSNQTVTCGLSVGDQPYVEDFTVSLADFNYDGVPEVYVGNDIFNAQTGTKIATGGANSIGSWNAGEFTTSYHVMAVSVAVDVLPDGACADCSGLELVAGNQVYSVNIGTGTMTVQRTAANSLPDGNTAIVDYDLDGDLDAVITTNNASSSFLYIWDLQTTAQIGNTHTVANTSSLFYHPINTPIIADFDGDNRPEIGVCGNLVFQVVEDHLTNIGGTGGVLWSITTTDNSGQTGASVFDFNGDGVAEVVYRDESNLRVISGPTGTNLATFPCGSGTGGEYAIIADIDNDSETEIVCNCSSSPGSSNATAYTTAFKSDNFPWVSTRKLWNQYAYFNVNINDDLTIPQQQQTHHTVGNPALGTTGTLNTFLKQVSPLDKNGNRIFPAPDLVTSTIVDGSLCLSNSTVALNIVISNNGQSAAPSGIPLAIYETDPEATNATLLGTITTNNSIPESGSITVSHTLDVSTFSFPKTIYIVVNDDNSESMPYDLSTDFPVTNIAECDFTNNKESVNIASGCIPVEICGNGIDDDGDGLTDCEDCADCASQCTIYDWDGDGINNFCDLDDDNDGIPDTDECPNITYGPELITNGDFENGYAYWTSDFNRGKNNNGPTSGGCGTQGWVALSPCASINGICNTYYDYNGSTPTGTTLITDPLGTGANVITTSNCNSTSGSCLAQVLPDHTTGTGLSLYIDPNDIPGQSYWKQTITVQPNKHYEFSAWLMTIEEDPNLVFKINNTNLTNTFNLDRLTGGSNGPDEWQPVITSWFSGTTSGNVVIELVNVTTGCGGNDIRLDDVSFREIVNFCDEDGDGIANIYDLDSDNDGLTDLQEAGHTAIDSDNDGVIDGANSVFGTNGLFDNLETFADSDLINYTIKDSESTPDGKYDAFELDSDSDGCFDAKEENVVDGDDDGIAGTGTPTITTKGLVTTHTYGTAPNNTWQNFSISNNCPEICNDGIDNDGDGLTDCEDPDCYLVSNTGGIDTDGDGIDDNCDIDDDGDGVLDTEECPIPTSSGFSGHLTGFTTNITSTNPSSSNVPHTLNSITYSGTTYTDFILPDGFQSFYSLTNNSGVRFIENGVSSVFDYNSPTYDQDILAAAYQSRNLNAYQSLDFNNFADGDYYELTYNAPILSTVGGFIAVTERLGNNQQIIQALDANGNIIGPTLTVETWHYVDLGYNVFYGGGTQNCNMALYPIEDLAPLGSSIYGLRISFGSGATGDGPDGKVFFFGNVAMAQCDFDGDGIPNHLDIDSDDDGITDLVESQGTSVTLPSGNDIDNDGLDDAFDNNTGNIDPTLSAGIPPDNFDGTGNPNHLDIDADDDGIPDNIEGKSTASYIAPSGADADGDGLDDAYDDNTSNQDPVLSVGISPVNTDGTDNVDYLDLNSDNDAFPDIQENGDTDNTLAGTDTDNDGLDDNFDTNNTNWDVNDNINDPNPSTLGDADGDVAADGNNAVGMTSDVDYRDAVSPEICNNGIDDDGDLLIDCDDPDCSPTISNVTSTNPNCPTGTNDGTITITASVPTGTLEYRLNSGTYQSSNVFNSLAPGTYTVQVRQFGTTCTNTWGSTITLVEACTEICGNGIDDDGDLLVDCDDPDCGIVEITDVIVSSCIDQPYADIATLDVTVSWDAGSPDTTIEVSITGKTHYINTQTETSPVTIQLVIPADGSINETVTASFTGYTCSDNDTYNAPNACSSDQLTCSMLYICGDAKGADADAFDHGLIQYIDDINGNALLTPALVKNEAGLALYDPMNPSTPLSLDIDTFDIILVSPSTWYIVHPDLAADLKDTEANVILMSEDLIVDLAMASNENYSYQTYGYSDNTTQVELYNFNNYDPHYSEIIGWGNYHTTTADVYLWKDAFNQGSQIQGVFFYYESTDVLGGVPATHGSRVFLGYTMDGVYWNDENGGAMPVPQTEWFDPIRHLTVEGKLYLDQAIEKAALNCAVEDCTNGIDDDGDGFIDCDDPDCQTETPSGIIMD